MYQKRIGPIILVLSWVSIAFGESGEGAFERWAKQYASNSVIEAANKSALLKVDANRVQLALNGSLRRTFVDWIRGSGMRRDIRSDRHQMILRVISEWDGAREPNELVIAFVGAQHAIELAFSGLIRHHSALYVFPNLKPHSHLVDLSSIYDRELESAQTADNFNQVEELRRFLRKDRLELTATQIAAGLRSIFHLNAL